MHPGKNNILQRKNSLLRGALLKRRTLLYLIPSLLFVLLVSFSAAVWGGPAMKVIMVADSSNVAADKAGNKLKFLLMNCRSEGKFREIAGLSDKFIYYDRSKSADRSICQVLGITANSIPALELVELGSSGMPNWVRWWRYQVSDEESAINKLYATLEQPASSKTPDVLPTAATTSKPAACPCVSSRETITNSKDGAKMVQIPAGEFLMGSASNGSGDDRPQHRVYLDAYCIGKYEVTNEQFRKFVNAADYKAEGSWASHASGKDRHPVVEVSWNDVMAYCRWAGGSLPTEAQWEKAARGTDGRTYPWGSSWDASRCRNSVGSISSGSTSVGSFSGGASPYGVHDMAGNVWECCSDWYGDNYYTSSPSRNPGGPGSGQYRVVRGGSWGDTDTRDFRCAGRSGYSPDRSHHGLGFRLCRTAYSR